MSHAETEQAKRALRDAIHRTHSDDRQVIDAAVAATADLDAAVTFRREVGLARLDQAIRAVERADDSVVQAGRDARRSFRVFRRVARGDADYFHSGHGTPLGGDSQEGSR